MTKIRKKTFLFFVRWAKALLINVNLKCGCLIKQNLPFQSFAILILWRNCV